jgi:hypothetical protein
MNIRQIHADYGDNHVVVKIVKRKINNYGFLWTDITAWGYLISADIEKVISVQLHILLS